MRNIVVVQQIRTKWTKAARGGKSAQKRNAVPELARIPGERVGAGELTLVHHLLAFGEANGFAAPHEEMQINPTLPPHVFGCVTVGYSEDAVVAAFRYDSRCGGAPDRGWARKTLHLEVGEWGQFVYNGRFSGWESHWWYEKMVVNVGLFERLTPGLFTREKPAHRFGAMAYLF